MEVTNAEFDEFRFPVRFLRLVGFSLPGGSPPSTFRRLVLQTAAAGFLALQALVVLQLALSPLVITANVTATAAFLSGSLLTLSRHLFFAAKGGDVAALVRFVQHGPHGDCEEFDAKESEMRLRSTRQVRRFGSVIFVYHVLAAAATFAIIFVLPSVLSREEHSARAGDLQYYRADHRPLYCDMWWPWPVSAEPTYYLVMLWQLLAVALNAACAMTSDAFACSLMLAAAHRGSLLARTAPVALLPHEGPADAKISAHFRAWLRYHQHYLLTFGKVNQLMGPVIFTTHFFAIFNIIAFSYFTMKADMFSALVALSYLSTVMVQVYTFASAGQHVIDHSEELGRSVVTAGQVARGGLREGPARSALLVLIARCSGAKPEEPSGMGYFVVSVPLFSAVLGASVSFLLVLIQFR